jgi:putative nucleotidyltransferase with HDIG domain
MGMNVEPKGKKMRLNFKENDLGLRLLIGLICWLCLAIFMHFREVKVEVLELNTTANRYIVAQVDFEFPDEEAMIILKQDAWDDIGKIYQIDERMIRQENYDFENLLAHDSSWREKVKDSSLDEMYKITDGYKLALSHARFTDTLTKNKMKKYQLITDHYFIFTPTKEKEKNVLPEEFWSSLRDDAFKNFPNTKKEVIDFVASFFEKKAWVLSEDVTTEANVKGLIENRIPQKFTEVKAGTRIIGQGEKVRTRHIAMLQAMKEALSEKRNIWAPFTIIGNLLLSLIIVAISALYLKVDQKEIFKSLQKLSLLVCIFILTLAFAKITEYILLQNNANLMERVHYPLIVPFAAILTLILFNTRISLYSITIFSIILATTIAIDHSRFLVINLVSSIVVIISPKALRRRKEVFEVCGKSLLGAIPVILAFELIARNFWFSLFLADIGVSILFTVIIAILVVGLLPILESLFNVMTDITLAEYMDPNNELLKRLTFEMPGTYQHSLVLGNLSEAAAQAVGANGFLCRAATLYHDIGKLNNAHFFTENQQAGVNIHQLLTPYESAQVIIAHVRDGVMLAKKYRLPQSFIDIIQEHHGTTLVYYFYRKELELQGGDESKVDKNKFRYPGPKPHSKEAAIIMIADGVEAASRSITEPTVESLSAMISQVIKDRADDGQFDECNLTFQEIGIIKKVLASAIVVTRHVRVKYPDKKEEQ